MVTSFTPRIWFAGARSGCGKSLCVTGVLQALRRRGLSVSCCVSGRPLQQATVLERLSRRYVRCLDSGLLQDEALIDAVGQAGLGSDIVLVDGNAGLFDFHGGGAEGLSDADIAQLVSCPCVLVVDAIEISNSLCAVVAGFLKFPNAPRIVGIIINGLERRELAKPLNLYEERQRCNELFSRYDLPPCVGCIPAKGLHAQCPPADVLQEVNWAALPLQFLVDLEDMITQGVDLDALLGLAQGAPQFEYSEILPAVPRGQSRIAVASDNCFHVCYQDNLDILRMYGAELVKFSPLADQSLPRGIGGVYLPGACLTEYAQDVESNSGILSAISEFVRQGGILFSEGAGSAILCRTFKPIGCDRSFRGAGLMPFDVVQEPTRIAAGDIEVLDGSALGEFGESARVLLTRDWQVHGSGAVEDMTSGVVPTLRLREEGSEAIQEGYSVSAESCSTFNFLHFGSNPRLAKALVEAAAIHQRTNAAGKH